MSSLWHRDYPLSKSHPIGRFKAALLARGGFEAGDWGEPASQLRALTVDGDAIWWEASKYGEKYLISGILKRPRGLRLEVTTVWLVP